MKRLLILSMSVFVLNACVSSKQGPDRDLASIFDKKSESFSDQRGPKSFDTEAVKKLVSSKNMKLQEARLIIDNDAAFDSKLKMIREAKHEIRMVYYIYSFDPSSAVLTQTLVNKAAQGVKVKLLVDLITNFRQIDEFKWMEKAGKGNLKVYFYNFPSEHIRSDAVYMTLPCPMVDKPTAKECATHKNAVMAKANQDSTIFSKILLAGMYGKNPTALKVAMGVGAGIDPKNYKSEKPDAEAQAQLLEFLKLVKDAYFKNDVIAKVKVAIAMATYGESLNPIMNELTGRLPFGNDSSVMVRRGQEWDHITDYTHHKLLAVDGTAFQLGGRNIEDSYHVKNRVEGDGKYIFIDTDFYGKGAPGQTADVEKAFDKILKINGMVADLALIEKYMAVDLVQNPEALMMATQGCVVEKAADLGSCIAQKAPTMPSYKNENARIDAAQTQIRELASAYLQKYKKVYRDTWRAGAWKEGTDSLSAKDLKTAEFYYIENLPFKKDTNQPERQLGSRIGIESQYSKNIHAAWYRGLEQACYTSHVEKKEARVIFNSAYVFMPSGLIYKLAKMINGDYGDCSRVRITFLSNSFGTTDLNIINIFARYQLKELFQYYDRVKQSYEVTKNSVAPRVIPQMFPTLEYYEYLKQDAGQGISLHTKLTLLGNDLIVGSANADTRSYAMDTNNAALIRNAHDMNKEYASYVDRLLADQKTTVNMSGYFTKLDENQIHAENIQILQAALARWDKKGRVKEKHQKRILDEVSGIGARISGDTRKILDFRRLVENGKYNDPQAISDVEKELNETANRFDDFFKLL